MQQRVQGFFGGGAGEAVVSLQDVEAVGPVFGCEAPLGGGHVAADVVD